MRVSAETVVCVNIFLFVREEGNGGHTQDSLRSGQTPIRHNHALRKNVLLKDIAEAVVDGDLDLLDDHEDGRLVRELVLEVGLAEQVVELVVEAVVLLVDDEHFLRLLHHGLLEAVVYDLQVVLLNVDDLLLVV
jgi:hypothetical protein